MASFREHSTFPFWCDQCGLVSVNIATRPLTCPGCSSHEVVPYGHVTHREPLQRTRWERWFGTKRKLTRTTFEVSPVTEREGDWEVASHFDRGLTKRWHRCPACREMTMEFQGGGIRFD